MLTEDQIKFLNKVCPNRWVECDGIITVNGGVNIEHMNLTEIPVHFGHIKHNFRCSRNKLTTLKGSPSIVEGYFNCDGNKLTTLEGGPKEVEGYYSCEQNLLTNLIGAPKICNRNFYCQKNKLTNLEGCPHIFKHNFYCSNNLNLELWGIGRVEREIYYSSSNKINLWILICIRKGIIFPYFTKKENINWIKQEQKYSILLDAPEEIWKYFSPYIKNILLDLC